MSLVIQIKQLITPMKILGITLKKFFRSQAELVIQKSIKGDCITSHHSDFNATDLSLNLYSSVDDCLKAGGRANK